MFAVHEAHNKLQDDPVTMWAVELRMIVQDVLSGLWVRQDQLRVLQTRVTRRHHKHGHKRPDTRLTSSGPLILNADPYIFAQTLYRVPTSAVS